VQPAHDPRSPVAGPQLSVPYSTIARAAVVRHFIPLYNLAWLVIWPYRMVRFLDQHLRDASIAPGILLGFLLLFSFAFRLADGGLSLLLIYWIVWYISSQVALLIEQTKNTYGAPAVFE
jgi:hypothetical protein